MDAHVAVLPGDWGHLRRHWVDNSLTGLATEHTDSFQHEPALCLLEYI